MSGKAPHAQVVVMRLRSHVDTLPPDVLDVVFALRDHALSLAHENNALRRNTERLQRRVDGLLKEVAAAKLEAGHAHSATRTAQTMAQHWRIKAEGGNYDATKEDGP